MGEEIPREHFTDDDFLRFEQKLRRGLGALEELVARKGFGEGPASIGAELELCLVDSSFRALHRNRAVLARAGEPKATLELDAFNLECNALPVALAGRPFGALGKDLRASVAKLALGAQGLGGQLVAVGILPTLRPEDLADALTRRPRYHALARAFRALRAAPFSARIDGDEPLACTADDVALCGAATSFQVHLRVTPQDFARTYNAAVLALAPALAVSVNAPLLLGHKLWHETRIALFAQATDARAPHAPFQVPRVGLGTGWCRQGVTELFASDIALHPVALPVISDEEPLEVVRAGKLPALAELKLHHGTIYPWVRPVYDPHDGGHLRIEIRPLPAGPSMIDMLANAAFVLGLTLALRDEVDRLLPAMPFDHARQSFFRAAKDGLGAELWWPTDRPPSPQGVPAQKLVTRLIPAARHGLVGNGVDADEADALLEVIAGRAASAQTGAAWQRAALAQFDRGDRDAALAQMLARYAAHAAEDVPVHAWPLP